MMTAPGERLCTRRMARMPEPNTATLKRQLTSEVMGALIQRPGFTRGQTGRWRTGQLELSGPDTAVWGRGPRFLSYDGASWRRAGSSLWGRTAPIPGTLETLRTVLRDAPQGVDKVMGALSRLRPRPPRRQAIHKALAYFREHRPRMRYADRRAHHLPLGSGGVEAACKTLGEPALEACRDALAYGGRASDSTLSRLVSRSGLIVLVSVGARCINAV